MGHKASWEPFADQAPDIDERGSFAHAACPECGWTGPGRRARETARRDQLRHEAEAHADGAGLQPWALSK